MFFSSYAFDLFDLRPDFVIWLNVAHFGHDGSHRIDDFDSTNHHRIIKQIAWESLEPQENVDTTCNIVD